RREPRPARVARRGGSRGRLRAAHSAAEVLHGQRRHDRGRGDAALSARRARRPGSFGGSGTAAVLMAAASVDPRRVLARHGLSAKKSWGQNFLHDRAVLGRIVAAAGAGAEDVVVEIGAGLGTLTAALAGAAPAPRRLLAIERDPDMQRVLAAELGGDARVEVVAADALTFDYLE